MAKGIVDRYIEYASGSAKQTSIKVRLSELERIDVVTRLGDEHEGHTRLFLVNGKCRYSRESLEAIEKAIREAEE